MQYIDRQKPTKNARQRMLIFHVLGCEQSVWMGNVTKVVRHGLQMEKRKVQV